MPRAVWTALGLGPGALALYFAFWPVPVDPVAWTPPPAPLRRTLRAQRPACRDGTVVARGRSRAGGRGAGRCGPHLRVHAGGTDPEIAPRRLGCRDVRGHE